MKGDNGCKYFPCLFHVHVHHNHRHRNCHTHHGHQIFFGHHVCVYPKFLIILIVLTCYSSNKSELAEISTNHIVEFIESLLGNC